MLNIPMRPSMLARLGRHSSTVAPLFAALGDATRLGLIAKLKGGSGRSLAQLCEGEPLTRQAISKHLRVLEAVDVVNIERRGRESLISLNQRPIDDARAYIDLVSSQWNRALARVKSRVEE